jgi:hypothetical protein
MRFFMQFITLSNNTKDTNYIEVLRLSDQQVGVVRLHYIANSENMWNNRDPFY